MKVIPNSNPGGSRTGTLSNITVDEINRVLGFTPNVDDDPDKVVNSWGFTVDGEDCGIWDYKGSQNWNQFSTCGPDKVFRTLFPNNYDKDRF
jgi:hypothetical protein